MAESKPGKLRQFVSFRIEDDLFGFDIRIVKEVNPHTDIAPVPLAPATIRGLVNIRGQIVLVVDIAVLFGRPPRPVTADSQLVLIKTGLEIAAMQNLDGRLSPPAFGDKPVAFLVDSIGDVLTVEAAAIDAVPPHIGAATAAFLEGVVRSNEELLVVLDAARLLMKTD